MKPPPSMQEAAVVEKTGSHDPVRNKPPQFLAAGAENYPAHFSAQAQTAVNAICPYCSHLVSLDHTCEAMESAWRQQNMLLARREKVTLWRRILEWLG